MSFNVNELSSYLAAFKLRFRKHNAAKIDCEPSEQLLAVFENEIKPKLDRIEQFRLAQLKAFYTRNRTFKLVVMPIAISLSVLGLITGSDIGALYPILLAFCIGTGWAYKPALDYVNQYKENVLPIIVKMYGDFNYSVKSKFTKDMIKKVSIAPSFDFIKTEDYVYGEIDNIHFEFSELKLDKKTKNGQVNVFKGGIITLTMPFDFNSHTLVKCDYGKVGNLLTKDAKVTEKVALENLDFEKFFEVYSDDQIMARYILTPVMMEQILKLNTEFMISANATRLECEFVDNKAIFMIDYKDNLLEPSWLEASAFELNALPTIEKELSTFTCIAKQLNLDLMASRRVATENVVGV